MPTRDNQSRRLIMSATLLACALAVPLWQAEKPDGARPLASFVPAAAAASQHRTGGDSADRRTQSPTQRAMITSPTPAARHMGSRAPIRAAVASKSDPARHRAATAAEAAATGALGPALSQSDATYASALQCSGPLAGAVEDPVLLVHGTGSTGPESWGGSFYPALQASGRVVCMVSLPDRALVDIQHSAEWVVWAIRYMAAASGRQVAAVGHSEGTLQPLWALRWWPDIASKVSSYVGIGAPLHGTTQANSYCAMPTGCNTVAWQYRQGSNFLGALFPNGVQVFAPGPSYTTISTRYDELVTPSPAASHLDGASNIVIQDICPGRPIDHLAELVDAVTYAITLDAITHPDGASASRIPPSICQQGFIPGTTPSPLSAMSGLGFASLFLQPVRSEPPLMPYAR